MQASASGRPLPNQSGAGSWLGSTGQRAGSLGKQESQIELPRLPWSDWEIPAEQITICKREDGSDWELGAGAFGKACSLLHESARCMIATLKLPWYLN